MHHSAAQQIRFIVLVVLTCLSVEVGLARAHGCPGDCDDSGAVTIDEVVLGGRLFFGTSVLAACPAADADDDGVVSATDLQAARLAYEGGCTAPRAAAFGAAAGTANALVTLATVTAVPGTTVSFGATLSTMGNPVVALQQDIAFSPLTPISGCAVNPTINRGETAFGFQPPGCVPGATCTGIRALVISFSDLSVIADGSLLFTCVVDVAAAAPDGTYALASSNTLASDGDGNALPLDAVDGAIVVAQAPTPTQTPVPVLASLILEKVRSRADTSRRPGDANGSILIVAVVDANAPFADLLDDIASDGLSLDVAGAGGVGETLAWDAADCATRSTRRGPRVRCANDSGGQRLDLRPLRPPNLFNLKVKARQLAIAAPLTADPVEATLRTSHFARLDLIGGCIVSGNGRVSTCRESGVVPTDTPAPTATPTPTATSTPTHTATPPESGTRLILGDAVGVAGGTAAFTVLLETDEAIAGTENEIVLDGAAPLVFTSCTVNPTINKSLPHSFRPFGCTAGVDCTGVKTLVLNLSNVDPIPTGSVLYSCEVAIGSGAAPGDYLIDCFAPGAATPAGGAVTTDCVDAVLTVLGP